MNLIPECMTAIVLTGPGEHELQEVPVPKPGPFEVLSKVRAGGNLRQRP